MLTENLSFKYGNSRVEVSTIDAAQGQEADLVIISLVRANATGSVSFTDDSKRLNVAITRAKAGAIIVGHLATTLAAGTSGIASLLHDLRNQGAIFEHARPEAERPLILMTSEDFDNYDSQFPIETMEARIRRKRDGKDRTIPRDTRDVERAPGGDTRHAVENTRTHLDALTNSTSFMLAMSHVCPLKQKIEYSNDIAPNSVADWDRKAWSFENHFTTPRVSVDVGNFILDTMLLAIRHSLGMEAAIDPHRQGAPDEGGARRPAPWTDPRCERHPVVSGAATTGMARK